MSSTHNKSFSKQYNMGEDSWTKVEDIQPIFAKVFETFQSGKTRPLAWRREQLYRFGEMIQENETALCEAVTADLARPHTETLISELSLFKHEINLNVKNLEKWNKEEKVATDLMWKATNPKVRKEPKGVGLVIGTWNYPISLLLVPVIGAITAGCTCIIKPSELAPVTAALIARLLPQYLDSSAYAVILGGIEQTSELLQNAKDIDHATSFASPRIRFDHIFYTGSTRIGKVVAHAAADMLCTSTLELGGKSPAVVLDGLSDSVLEVVAKRVAWGKWINAGQVCIAPDYILTTPSTSARLIPAIKRNLATFSASSSDKTPASSLSTPDYSRIISPGHYSRLCKLLDQTKGKVVYGGGRDDDTRGLEVTVVEGVDGEDSLMSEELFGPILPVVTLPDRDVMASFIKARETPLALYVFSQKAADVEYFLHNVPSGTFLHNDCIMQFIIPNLPFGGRGGSGWGTYHGKATFDAFTSLRPHASTPIWMDLAMKANYPPYTPQNLRMLLLIIGSTVRRPRKFGLGLLLKTIGVLIGVLAVVKGGLKGQ